jgi:uncharacterized protein
MANSQLTQLIDKLKIQKDYLEREFAIEKIGLFGSYVKDQQKQGSDLDVLVEFKQMPGLFRYIELENYLTKQLGVKVDLVLKDSLKPNIGKQILEETTYV